MKVTFKKLCCMVLALLFSLNLANISLSVKAGDPPSPVAEEAPVVTRNAEYSDFVITKEMIQEILDQRIKNTTSDKNAMATFMLALFGGNFGLHRFYVGKWGTGLLYLATGGFLGIGWVIDVIRIIFEDFEDGKHLLIKF